SGAKLSTHTPRRLALTFMENSVVTFGMPGQGRERVRKRASLKYQDATVILVEVCGSSWSSGGGLTFLGRRAAGTERLGRYHRSEEWAAHCGPDGHRVR